METVTMVIIAVVVVAVIAAVVAVIAARSSLPARRTARLRKRFGPEYDHAVEAHGDAAAAERDLSERLRRREDTTLRELSDHQRAAHSNTWTVVQQEFVDDPVGSVRGARGLVEAIMADRGYPGPGDDEGFEPRLRDLSVDHPTAVADFRHAHASGLSAEADRAGTEHMREELVSYRGLVEALLGGLPAADGADHRAARPEGAVPEQTRREREREAGR